MSALQLIGYWRAQDDPTDDLPHPSEWVDWRWDADERAEVGAYLASGTFFRAFMGFSPCRICGQPNGSGEYTDGNYVWPEGLAHYVSDHGVRLPEEVVAHAMSRSEDLEGRTVSDAWWREQSMAKGNLVSSASTSNPIRPSVECGAAEEGPSVAFGAGAPPDSRFLEASSVWLQMAKLLVATHGPQILASSALATLQGGRAEFSWTEIHEMTADEYQELVEEARRIVQLDA